MVNKKPITLPNTERIVRIKEVISDLETHFDVERSKLRQVLLPAEWKSLKAELLQLYPCAPKIKPPSGLECYKALLRKADRLHARPKNVNRRAHSPGFNGKKYNVDGEDVAYERAFEYLGQLWAEFPHLGIWLDRLLSTSDLENNNFATIEGMPRLRTSRSSYALALGLAKRQKSATKLYALRASLECIQEQLKVSAIRDIALPSSYARGISNVPVDPDAIDEWAFADNGWRLI
ncbi:hypothetical protein [Janthinobacterium sp. SUN033]|uniref:hypothetical protein n=1 Tax=Janthinobacterium sp. SUN033 TaxID=3002439 RepID=UPI0025AF8DA7|nr:hypothetical protein [Janthinobacterium sp. SUN033]MDN2677663.1 hypothetical protein [Janthinobacterium sp. SUN033]